MALTQKNFSDLITFTRSSGGGRFNSAGQFEWLASNAPRFDYDPVTLQPKGLLIEEQRTNLFLHSGAVSEWSKLNVAVTSTAVVSPVGQYDARKVVALSDGGVAGQHRVQQITTTTVGSTITLSIFAKAGERGGIGLRMIGVGTFASVFVNLLTGSINGGQGTVVPVGNGWYRISISGVADATSITSYVNILETDTSSAITNFVGNDAAGLYIWGAQLEVGAFPTSYIPTPSTFTSRASTATYFDSNGVLQTAGVNVARTNYVYNGSAWVSGGLLLEEQRANRLHRSVELNPTFSWNPVGASVVKNVALAPNGTMSGTYISTPVLYDFIQNSTASVTAGEVVCASVFAKRNSGKIGFRLQKADSSQTIKTGIDTTARTITYRSATGATHLASYVIPVSAEWDRYVIVGSLVDASTNVGVMFVNDATGDTGATLWGAQLEAGSYPTSYIPTPSTFTSRASTATYFDSNGVLQTAGVNVARTGYFYNGSSWVSGGVLFEEQRTNLLTESEFRNGVTDALPRAGLVNATTFTGFAGGISFGYDGVTDSYAYKQITTTVGQAYTLTFFIRMDDGGIPVPGTSSSSSLDFVPIGEGSTMNAVVTNLGGGLYAVSASRVATGGGGITNWGIVKYKTNSSRTFKVTGYMLEQGSYPTSYIPTTTAQVTRSADVSTSAQVTRSADVSTSAQVTRSADVASVNTLSPWFNASEGTLLVDVIPMHKASSAQWYAAFTDGTLNNVIDVGGSSNINGRGRLLVGGVTQMDITVSVMTVGVAAKIANAYRQNDSAVSCKGQLTQDGSCSIPSGMTALYIGRINQYQYSPGHIRSIRYYPRRLTDAELQELTR